MSNSAFLEMFGARDIIDYTTGNAGVRNFMLESLFPENKVNSNDFMTLVDKTELPQIAHVHALDATAEKATYEREVETGKAFRYARSEEFDEEKMVEIETFKRLGYAKYEPLAENVLKSGVRLTNAIKAALELARVQVLTTGKFSQNDEKGKKVEYDFKLDKDQKLAKVNFADPEFDPIQYLIDTQANANFEVTRGLTSTKALAAMRSNKQVVQRVLGINATVQSVMPGDFNNYLMSQGLPALLAYSGKYDEIGKDGKKTTKSFIEDGAFALFGDGPLGETVYGVTPEESRLFADPSVNVQSVGNIMLSTYSTVNPITNVVLGTATATPTLAQRYSLLQGTVL